MIDNNLIKGFDEDKDDSLKFYLEKVEDIEKCIIVNLTGYVDTYNSSYFQKQIEKIINAGYIRIILSCYNLNYVSSTGIGYFTEFLKSVKSSGGDVVLVNVQPKVIEVFQLLGFSQFFVFKENINDASLYLKKEMAGVHSVFPRVVSCPVCSNNLRATKEGRFRCSGCKAIIAIDSSGNVSLG